MKDRLLMEGDPHQLIEGAIISAYAIQAGVAYIFLRWEYKLAAERLRRAIDEAYVRAYLGQKILGSAFNLELSLHVSAGRYMCGEETGLLNALEGKRATPAATNRRIPQVSGLWGKPTVVNNVETVCNVPHIVKHGAEWFRQLSRTEDGGTKIYGVSGRVQHPGAVGTAHGHHCPRNPGGARRRHARGVCLPRRVAGRGVNRVSHCGAIGCKDGLRIELEKAGSRLGTGHHDRDG